MSERDRAFIDKISDHRLLTQEDEFRLGSTIQRFKTGKEKSQALEELIECNQRLVIDWAAYYHRVFSNISVMDFIQSGNIGLGYAAERFNPIKFKNRFSTYATPYIRLYIRKWIDSSLYHIKIPSYLLDKIPQYYKIMNEGEHTLSDEELTKALDVSDKVLKHIRKSQASIVHMDKPLDGDKERTYANVLSDSITIAPDAFSSRSNLNDILWEAVYSLDLISRDIVISQYLMESKITLAELGKKYNLTGERIRQIKVSAINKLKAILKNNGFDVSLIKE